MNIKETFELLGKNYYTDIPEILTLKNIPTASELDYVGSEDFDKVMIESILPQAVEEQIDFYSLLEVDYQLVCRYLRILNYGPYYTTNQIFCNDCGARSRGEYRVNLNTIGCKPLPAGFKNEILISKDNFLDYPNDVKVKLLTTKEALNARTDKAFKLPNGTQNREFARLCYSITALGNRTNLTPVEVSIAIRQDFSAADYRILRDEVNDATDYGLRAGGYAQCPSCGSKKAAFIAFADDRFFRPTLGDLREWKSERNRSTGADKDLSRDQTEAV